jgi:prepilin-type N-terminal cleavage/methylation domain-containing protein
MRFQLKHSTGCPGQGASTDALPACFDRVPTGGRKEKGFTLVEVVIAMAVVALVFAGIINAYVQSGLRLEWTGYSLAAQSLAIETMEQARSTVWDPTQVPPVNEITNLNLAGTSFTITSPTSWTWTGHSTNILDVPYGSNTVDYIVATNYVTVQMTNVNTYTNVQIELVQVQTVWPFFIRKQNLYFTNTICSFIAPDNRASSSF